MSIYLTESDVLTLDFGTLPMSPNPDPKQNNTQKSFTSKTNWSNELKKRLDANAKLSPQARENEADIEDKFWLDFFTVLFGKEIAKILIRIELLKKDIKILGFKKQTNPLLAFLSIKYVQTELILTKLINSNTYKAIHNAIANRYIADSEFLKANDYNILYCRDLYLKTVDIEEYLIAQKKVLPPNITSYDTDRLDRNKRIFLQLGQKSVKSKNAKLNSLEAVNKLLGIKKSSNKKVENDSFDNEDEDEETAETKQLLTNSKLSRFCKNSPARAFTTLQYLSVTFGNEDATEALLNNKFKDLHTEDIVSASREIAKVLHSYKIDKKSITELVNTIINEI